MANSTLETPRAAREEAKAPESGKPGEEKENPPASGGGKLKPWLPLIVAVVTMPALAYATTHFLLLPKLQHAMASGKPGEVQEPAAESGAGAKSEGKGPSDKLKVTVSLNKML